MPSEERRARAQAMITTAHDLSSAITASTWQEAEQRVADVLAKRDPMVQDYFAYQSAAVLMLDQHLLNVDDQEMSEERLALIGRYTNILGTYESPETDLVVRALQQLESVWSPEKRAEIARVIASAATAQLARDTECPGCSMEQVIQRLGKVDHDAAVREGVDSQQAIRAIQQLQEIVAVVE